MPQPSFLPPPVGATTAAGSISAGASAQTPLGVLTNDARMNTSPPSDHTGPDKTGQDNAPPAPSGSGQLARDPDSHHSGLADDDTPLHVLVADDEPVILDEIIEFFTDEGMAITAAPDGTAAAALFAAAPAGQFTVVLTDLRMPGQDGYALTRGINSATARANAVEVMIMTGHGSYGSTFSNPNIDVFEFIKKPLNLERLADAVRRAHGSAMARRRRQRAQAAAAGELRGELARLDRLAVALDTDGARTAGPLPALLTLASLLSEDAALLPPERMRLYAAALRESATSLGAPKPDG